MPRSCFRGSWEHSEPTVTTGTRAGANVLARKGRANAMRLYGLTGSAFPGNDCLRCVQLGRCCALPAAIMPTH